MNRCDFKESQADPITVRYDASHVTIKRAQTLNDIGVVSVIVGNTLILFIFYFFYVFIFYIYFLSRIH